VQIQGRILSACSRYVDNGGFTQRL
jgi:hypothetical protein